MRCYPITTLLSTTALFLAATSVPAHAQELELFPAQGPQSSPPQAFMDACLNLNQWPYTRQFTSYLGVVDIALSARANENPSQVSTCFQNMNAAGLGLSLGTAALKEWCTTGQDCFNAGASQWNLFLALGANISTFVVDEPLWAVMGLEGWPLPRDPNYALIQTAEFIRLVRQNYPGVRIVMMEPYPVLSAPTLNWWITDLVDQCAAIGTIPPDYFELDHDWSKPYGTGDQQWNWGEVVSIRDTTRLSGMGFGVAFWAADAPSSNSDGDWYAGVLRQGADYQSAGINPDLYSIDSWLNIPHVTVPEALYSTSFMGTADTFISLSYFPHCAGGGPDCLIAPQTLQAGQSVWSADGRFRLVYQGDGNLVLYNQAMSVLWASNTGGTSPGQAVMQYDGNFVVYDAGGQWRWASWTGGHPGAYLAVQNDGNLVVYSPDGPPLWWCCAGGQ